ncbi:MAG: MFS transporter [Planctomycetota bacterium]
MDSPPAVTRSEDRVPVREKLALGVGSLTAFFGFAGPERLAWPVLGMLLGLDGWLIGVCLLIPRLWDAITDPLMGKISDNTRSGLGRRRPYILLGAALMAVTFIAMWYLPGEASDRLIAAWFVASQIVFFTAYTVYAVPFTALSYELTPDYNERTRVMAFLGFFHKAGEFVGGWMPAMIVALSGVVASEAIATGEAASTSEGEMTMSGVQATAWVLGIGVFLLVGAIPGLFVRERFAQPVTAGKRVRMTEAIGAALTNRAFLVLVSVIIFNTLSGILASGIDQFVLVYYMNGGDQAAGLIQKGVLTSGYAFVGFVSIPVITWIANRAGKTAALYLVYWLMVIGGIAKWFIFMPGHSIVMVLGIKVDPIILIDPLLCGPMWVAVKILLASMMADICDEDEFRYGQRREGLFGAAFSWLEKLIVSLAALSTGLALTVSGFDAALGAEQDPRTFISMRLFLAGAPSLTALFAIIALRFYPIDAARAAETRAALEARRGVLSASKDDGKGSD